MRRNSSFKEKWRGSTRSLAGFLKPGGQTSLSRQESLSSLAEGEQVLYREEDDRTGKKSLRRNLSRRVRDTFTKSVSYPISTRNELSRAQSLSSLSISGQDVRMVPENLTDPRKTQRKDLPVCWLDPGQTKVKHRWDKERDKQIDLVTRLSTRPFTRHLARYLLTFMKEKDMAVMVRVSRQWRVFLLRELKPAVFSRIRNLEIIGARKPKSRNRQGL